MLGGVPSSVLPHLKKRNFAHGTLDGTQTRAQTPHGIGVYRIGRKYEGPSPEAAGTKVQHRDARPCESRRQQTRARSLLAGDETQDPDTLGRMCGFSDSPGRDS